MAEPSPTEALVCAQPQAQPELAVVVKRTFSIRPDGRCVLADEQLPIVSDYPAWDSLESPWVAPPRWDNDLFAFKAATDVVVQGHAYGYGRHASVDCEVRVGALHRIVRAHGERRLVRTPEGTRMTAPRVFQQIPMRYDYAYGGYDVGSHRRDGDPIHDGLDRIEPKWNTRTMTEFHYPRNPAGVGFIVRGTPTKPEDLHLPNLEHPADPITLPRLAVASPTHWMQAPLPAGFDWYGVRWFPRIGYLGLTPPFEPAAGPPAEIAWGWSGGEVLTTPPVFKGGWHPGFVQAASPGMGTVRLRGGEPMLLRHLFATHPERRIELPAAAPRVRIRLSATEQREAVPQLNAVVVQPDEARVVMVWSARCPVARVYHASEYDRFSWTVTLN